MAFKVIVLGTELGSCDAIEVDDMIIQYEGFVPHEVFKNHLTNEAQTEHEFVYDSAEHNVISLNNETGEVTIWYGEENTEAIVIDTLDWGAIIG